MEGSVGIVRPQTVTLFAGGDELELDCGRRLGPIDVVYETYGRLSGAKDNVVWLCHALTGDAHVAGKYSEDDENVGWWEDFVGPGKTIDTDKYFVVCSNILAGCKGTAGPGSVNPQTGKVWGLDFPVVTIGDMVRVQKALLDHLGIERILCVIGGSMGGMQVLEWATRYPEVVVSAIPIATTPRLSAQAIAFSAVGRNALLADPNFKNGEYTADALPSMGLGIARMIGHITYLSEQSMHEKFGRTLRNGDKYAYDFNDEFSVETYLAYQGRKFIERFDANSYLYITRSMDYYDLSETYGSLDEAFARTDSRFLLASFSSDWLFTPEQTQQMVRSLLANGKDATYCNVESPYGHDAFLLEPEILGSLVSGFLSSNLRKVRTGSPVLPISDASDSDQAAILDRAEYPIIERLIKPESRVLDLGCGDGGLLQLLGTERNVVGCGLEIVQERVLEAVNRGITVVQHDMDRGLPEFPDDSFDYVILSQTLPEVYNPELVFKEVIRIGKFAIVSFPNFAHWQARWKLAVAGVAPVTSRLPGTWYDTDRIRFLSLRDFEEFCSLMGAKLVDRYFLDASGREIKKGLLNLRTEQAIYVITKT